MTPNQIASLQDSLLQAEAASTALRKTLFRLVGERHPAIKASFAAYAVPEERTMLARILSSVLESIDPEPWVREDLGHLGRRHLEWDTEPQMYGQLTDCLMLALAEVLESDWTNELEQLWRLRMRWVCDAMQSLKITEH
jgi:hemoglobin-like flavoprotein